jgi:serine/threonine-protein kinase RsbT
MAHKDMQDRLIDVRAEQDVWLVIAAGTGMARELGMVEADCARVETVLSELAHNIFVHGGGGTVKIGPVIEDQRHGLRICAQDTGPGIQDVSHALQDGFTTRSSLGIGLGITKRMMDDMAIRSHPGWGTVVTVTKWLREKQ